MPLYTLKKLIAECAKKTWKTRRMPKGIPERERVQIYEEIWMALNLWLRATMEQGKGGHIPSFGTFCWELDIVNLGREDKIKRKTPVFVLDKIMKTEFGAKPWRRPVAQRTLTKPVEMNFVELAIRWSAILTKDLVFSGLRDMLARLRLVIKRGYKLKVRFGVGKLLVKERRVAFIFDPNLRIQKNKSLASLKTLPTSMTVAADSEIGDLLQEASDGGSVYPTARSSIRLTPLATSSSAPQLMTESPAVVPNLDLTGVHPEEDDVAENMPSSDAPTFRTDTESGITIEPTSSQSQEEQQQRDVTAFNADRSCVFAVSEKYRGGSNPDRLDRTAMRDALALAYERHLIDVEGDIATEEAQADHWRYQLWERELQYRKNAEKKQADLAELDIFLRTQISEQKSRIKEDDLSNRGTNERGRAYPNFKRLKRLAKIYGVYKDKEGRWIQATKISEGEKMMLTNRSETESSSSTGDMTERAKQEEAVRLGLALRDQIEIRMEQMNQQRKNELEEGRTFIEQINWDSQRMLSLMETEKTKTATDLKNAWDRDTHVRNVLKLRRKMLKRGGFVFSSKPPTPADSMDRLAPAEAYERRRNGTDGSAPPRSSRRNSSKKKDSGTSSRGVRGSSSSSKSSTGSNYISQIKDGMEKVNLTGTQSIMVPAKQPDMSVGYDMRSAR